MKRIATSVIGYLLVTTVALGCGEGQASDDGFEFEEEALVCDPLPSIAPHELRTCEQEGRPISGATLEKLDGCQEFNGSFAMTRTGGDLSPLQDLVRVNGGLTMGPFGNFENVESLGRLERAKRVSISGPQLFPGFERMRRVDERLFISPSDGKMLKHLRSLSDVRDLTLLANHLPDLRRISCLTAIDGDLQVLNSPLEGEGLPDEEVDALITQALLRLEVRGDVYLNDELWEPSPRE